MIHHVTGPVVRRGSESVVVEVGGIGLELFVSDGTARSLPGVGGEAHLRTHLAVRDDGWTLYGFATEEERNAFRLLLGVQGIGPRLALGILSGLPLASLRRAIGTNDLAALTRVSGVGKKTAQRMVVDLKEKLGLPEGDETGDFGLVPAAAEVFERDDVVDALVALGYPRPSAREAVRFGRDTGKSEPGDTDTETLLKRALRRL